MSWPEAIFYSVAAICSMPLLVLIGLFLVVKWGNL